MDPAQPNTSAVTCSANRAAGTSAAAARPRPTNPPPPPPPPRPPCPPPPAPLPPPPRWLLVVVEGVGRWWVPGVGVAPRVAAARPPARATLGRKASGLSRAAPILWVRHSQRLGKGAGVGYLWSALRGRRATAHPCVQQTVSHPSKPIAKTNRHPNQLTPPIPTPLTNRTDTPQVHNRASPAPLPSTWCLPAP